MKSVVEKLITMSVFYWDSSTAEENPISVPRKEKAMFKKFRTRLPSDSKEKYPGNIIQLTTSKLVKRRFFRSFSFCGFNSTATDECFSPKAYFTKSRKSRQRSCSPSLAESAGRSSREPTYCNWPLLLPDPESAISYCSSLTSVLSEVLTTKSKTLTLLNVWRNLNNTLSILDDAWVKKESSTPRGESSNESSEECNTCRILKNVNNDLDLHWLRCHQGVTKEVKGSHDLEEVSNKVILLLLHQY